jgi:Mg2+/Co2+ transporter CorC
LAATEFGLSPKTVAQRVHAAGVLPGEDGLFSTADVHGAICGDIEQERLRNLQKVNRDLDTNHAKEVGELVDVEDFAKRYETIYAEIRQTILGSKLSDADKDALLDKLAKLHSRKRGPGPDV